MKTFRNPWSKTKTDLCGPVTVRTFCGITAWWFSRMSLFMWWAHSFFSSTVLAWETQWTMIKANTVNSLNGSSVCRDLETHLNRVRLLGVLVMRHAEAQRIFGTFYQHQCGTLNTSKTPQTTCFSEFKSFVVWLTRW